MGVVEWTLVAIIALGVLAAVARRGISFDWPGAPRVFAPTRKGASFGGPRRRLRSRIRAEGGRARRIPNAALDEIIAHQRALAEKLADSGLSAYADPRKTLERMLDGEASVIARYMRGERRISGSQETFDILVKHGLATAQDGARLRADQGA